MRRHRGHPAWACLFALAGAPFVALAMHPFGPTSATQPSATKQPLPTQSSAQPPASQSIAATEPGVTLHLQNKSREELLSEFGHAAHVSFADPAPGFWFAGNWSAPTVNLDDDNKPFWDALADLQEATDIGFVADDSGEHITPTREIGDWGWTGRPEAVSGPMLLSVRQVSRQTTVPLGDPSSATDQITMVVQSFIQPGADWHVEADGFEMNSLLTDQGLELQSQKKPLHAASQHISGRNQCQFSAFAPVDAKISWVTLTGSCHCIGSPSEDLIEIPNAESASMDRSVAGLAVHLGTSRSAHSIEARMTCKVPPGVDRKGLFAFRQRLSLIWDGRVKMFDGNGIELVARPGFDRPGFGRPTFARRGFRTPGSTMPAINPAIDHVDLILNFTPADAPAPFKIVWTVPTALNNIVLPVQIEQIPVP